MVSCVCSIRTGTTEHHRRDSSAVSPSDGSPPTMWRHFLWTSGGGAAMRNESWVWPEVGMPGRAAREQSLWGRHCNEWIQKDSIRSFKAYLKTLLYLGGSSHKYNFCRDKNMFVATKRLSNMEFPKVLRPLLFSIYPLLLTSLYSSKHVVDFLQRHNNPQQ